MTSHSPDADRTTEPLERGRDAIRRHAWPEAIEALTQADRDSGLGPEDLELLASALFWAGRPGEAMAALERAFAGHSAAGRNVAAAGAALNLAYIAFRGMAGSVGGGWLARATRLLEAEPESPIHAWPFVFEAIGALTSSHYREGIAAAERAIEIGRRQGNTDAVHLAMSFVGMANVFSGNLAEGLALIDEAAAAASSGQLDLRVASDIYCNTISACRSIGDLGRAAQWADEGERFMEREAAAGYPGICRIHRAELKKLRGRWSEAEQEARKAGEELARFGLLDGVGFAYNEVGEVRLRMGDLEAAGEAFDKAYEYGHDGQPGLSLLTLARGDVAEARRSIDRALAMAAGSDDLADRATRARLLPAKVDIALAGSDLEGAREAVEELESIAADFQQPLFQAGAMTARGELLLGLDRAAEATPVLGRSWRLWQTTDLPYESARARLHYAEALAREGDSAMARRDLEAARSVFERLGATLDLERVDRLLEAGVEGGGAASGTVASGGGTASLGAGSARGAERVTRTFMFTDIVTSTELVEAIGDGAWAEVLRWHDRELRSAFAEHGGEEVAHTGDGFFVAFPRPADAIEGAVEIQRRLIRHRRDHGFAPWVRIGLHTAEATRRGRDYSGAGVHVAARVGAAAGREEILVTRAVLDTAGGTRFRLAESRSVKLKGVREPVEVVTVAWQ